MHDILANQIKEQVTRLGVTDLQTPEEVDELACYQCGASVYSVAAFCWQCHAPVHCCNNCMFRHETRCKELQGLTSTMSQVGRNECPWWRVTQ